ncbi:MAG: hypothetical protein QHG99_09065 [Methanomicrobiales archaeon]|nr:hypothetical protein [Methanomicrobiales archaeon]
MDFRELLSGKGESLRIYDSIARCLENVELFPVLIEPIYREALVLDEERLDRIRFALLRVQIFADIHRNEDMEQAQRLKYVAQVLEKVIFGNLMLEKEEYIAD